MECIWNILNKRINSTSAISETVYISTLRQPFVSAEPFLINSWHSKNPIIGRIIVQLQIWTWKLLFIGNRQAPDFGNSPVQHMRDDSWLGGAMAVQDNGERLVVCW